MLLDKKICKALRQGAMVLTANQQLAVRLRQDYQAQQSGVAVWPTPWVFYVEEWLRQSFFRYQETLSLTPAAKKPGRLAKNQAQQLAWFPSSPGFLTLLSPAQSLALWEQVLRDWQAALLPEDPELALLQLRTTAEAAYQSYCFCCKEVIDFAAIESDPQHRNAPEHLHFLGWWRKVSQRLQANAWLDSAALANVLQNADWQKLWPESNQQIIFYDFDVIPKNLENLKKVLKKAKLKLGTSKTKPLAKCQFQYAACQDSEDELKQAALWAKQQLAARKKSIAIISRDVAALRPRLTPYLLAALHPKVLGQSQAAATCFRFNIGQSLTDFSLVQAGLTAWSLLAPGESLPLPNFGDWLRSPFFPWWANGEVLEKYRWELYDQKNPELLFSQLIPPPAFQDFYQKFLEVKKDLPPQATWSTWLGWLRKFWQAVGFARGRTLNSAEFQCQERLFSTLENLLSLEYIIEEDLSFSQFSQRLSLELQAVLLEPQSRNEAPLQILGVLEAESQRFDAIWLLDVQARHWPAPARPLPFLRQALQQNRPESSPEGQLAKAERLLAALLKAAPVGVVSCALQGEEGQSQSPSALLPILPAFFQATTWQHPWQQNVSLTPFCEATLTCPPKVSATVLEYQASCPFRGQVAAQLSRLKPFPEALPFFSSRERGILLHAILEKFFRKHPDASALVSQITHWDADLPMLVTEAFVTQQKKRPQALAEPYFLVEKAQAFILLKKLFTEAIPNDLKALRVDICEFWGEALHAGVSIHFRLDRLDSFRSEDPQAAGYVLWDYKTGSQVDLSNDLKTQDESGEPQRLKKPQLALYALHSPKQPLGKVGYIHLHANAKKIYHLQAVNQEILRQWQQALDDLVKEIQSGLALIQPQKGACQYCGYTALCRHPHLEKSQW